MNILETASGKTVPDNDSPDGDVRQEERDDKPLRAVEEREIGGRGGLDPTRYGDWEKDGRCIDF